MEKAREMKAAGNVPGGKQWAIIKFMKTKLYYRKTPHNFLKNLNNHI